MMLTFEKPNVSGSPKLPVSELSFVSSKKSPAKAEFLHTGTYISTSKPSQEGQQRQ